MEVTGLLSNLAVWGLCAPTSLLCAVAGHRARKARSEAQIEADRRKLQKAYFESDRVNSDNPSRRNYR